MIPEVLNAPVESETLEDRFRRLNREWGRGTAFISNPNIILDHPAAKEIVALGESAIPLIMAEIENKSSLLCWLLPDITGVQLATPDISGRVDVLCQRWLVWGKENGYR